MRRLVDVLAERPFGETWPGFAGGYELARKFDEIGGDLDGRARLFKDRGLAEGDLFVESFDLVRSFVPLG